MDSSTILTSESFNSVVRNALSATAQFIPKIVEVSQQLGLGFDVTTSAIRQVAVVCLTLLHSEHH